MQCGVNNSRIILQGGRDYPSQHPAAAAAALYQPVGGGLRNSSFYCLCCNIAAAAHGECATVEDHLQHNTYIHLKL